MSTAVEMPEITNLVVIEPKDIQVTFSTPGSLTPLLDRIAQRAREFTADVNTPKGRKDIASLAAKISKAKTALDGIGKDLVDGLKELPKKVDASRKEARDFLDILRDEVRKPLTEWEQEEERRIAARAAELEAEKLAKEIDNAHELANFMNAEFDRKWAEQLKAEELARQQRDERVAKEAAEREQRKAEEAAKIEREASERREAELLAAQLKAQREAMESEARAKALQILAEREKAEAEQRAERERIAAIERQEKAKAEAVESERRRVEEEKRKTEAEQAKREANKRHRNKILAEVTADVHEVISGITGSVGEDERVPQNRQCHSGRKDSSHGGDVLITLDIEQGKKAWFDARRGLVTASRIADAICKPKRKEGELAARRNYRLQIVSEILTGISADHYVSGPMEYGTENEPLARTAYEMETGNDVTRVGFVLHPTISRAGCSPDGVIGEVGLLELKVPNTDTHIQYLIDGVVPDQYIPQMYWQMACAGPEIEWADFCSHDPRIKEKSLQTFICRLPRDNAIIAEMESEALVFLAEVDDMMNLLKARMAGQSITEYLLQKSISEIERVGPQPIADALEINQADMQF